MKRTFSLAAVVAFSILATGITAMAQSNTPSVPNLVNFQGRLTDNVGNPVADGAHAVHFYIYDDRTAGTLLWDELQNPTTTGGLFTTQLGSVNTLPASLFNDYDSLFLQLVADGQTISPRTLLSCTPFTRTAEGLNGRSPYTNSAYIKTDPAGHLLATYGADGQEQIRLWGPGWGEMWLHDASPSNFINAILEGDNFPGGALFLGDGAGSNTIALQGGAAGDNTAILPTDAIDSREILDEPGIAHTALNPLVFALTGAPTAYDTVSITAPTAGFVVVTAYAQVNINHALGTEETVEITISTTAGVHDFDNAAFVRVSPSEPTYTGSGISAHSVSCTKVEAVGAGVHTYFLNADGVGTPGHDFFRRHLTAMFFPTNYGTVVSTMPATPDGQAQSPLVNADAVSSNVPSSVQVTTVADHKDQLNAAYAKQIADLEARMKALESKQNAAQQGSPR